MFNRLLLHDDDAHQKLTALASDRVSPAAADCDATAPMKNRYVIEYA